MIAIRIVCAYDAVEKAKAIARLLSADGHIVSIACGKAALDDITPDGDPECVVFVWTLDGAFSPYVTPWVKATDPSYAVELNLSGKPPFNAARREEPIDFSHWRQDRVSECWKEFERRIRRVDAIDTPRAEPVRAAMAYGAAGVAVLAAAIGLRLFDKPATDLAENAPPPVSFESTQLIENGQGGLSPATRLTEPDDADAESFTRSRVLRARALPASPGGDDHFIEADVVEPMTFRDRNLLDALTSRLRDLN